MAQEYGFYKVEFHFDSKAVVFNLVYGKGESPTGLSLLKLNWKVFICHIFREAKSCADVLTNLTCNGGSSLII